MRERGQLVQWNDARGFGFVQGDAGGGRIFVHISAFQPAPSATRRPLVGRAPAWRCATRWANKAVDPVRWRWIGKRRVCRDLAPPFLCLRYHAVILGRAPAASEEMRQRLLRPAAVASAATRYWAWRVCCARCWSGNGVICAIWAGCMGC